MKTLTTLAVVALLGIRSGLTQEMQILDQVRKEIVPLEGGAGDAWDYSGSGGYVFRFSQDVLGDFAAEHFVNVSVRPNVWHVFIGNDTKNIGDIRISGSGFLLRRDSQSATLLDTYQPSALEKYVIEQQITVTGIRTSARKVGDGASEEEYQAILNRDTSGNTAWVVPQMEGILLYDLLNQSSPKWFDFNPDKAHVRNGYYRLPGDEDRISGFESVFTPKVALDALNQALRMQQAVGNRDSETARNLDQMSPVLPTTTPILQPESTTPAPPSLKGMETKLAPFGFPIVTMGILATAIVVGIALYLFRRRST